MTHTMFMSDVGGPIKQGDVLEICAGNILRKTSCKRLLTIPFVPTVGMGWRVMVAAENVVFASKPVELALVFVLDLDDFLDYVSMGIVNQANEEWADDCRRSMEYMSSLTERWNHDGLSGGVL